MPIGTRHEITGLLTWTDGRLCLFPDDGGTWRLEHGRSAAKFAGHRATVRGVRIAFDVLDVDHVRRVGTDPPVGGWERVRRWSAR